ncbi:MAG: hypothetical protein HRT87_12665, partial [Legionellales bacterium]|nr:hypothetical protein [Legionellales bacterium]
MNAHEFIDYYIFIRHPHHFLLSKILNTKSTISWIWMYSTPIIFALFLKNKNLTIMGFFCLISFILSILLHYLGTEVFQLKIMAIAGLNRFTCYRTLVWLVEIFLIFGALLNRFFKNYQEDFNIKHIRERSMCYSFLVIVYIIVVLVVAIISPNYVYNKSRYPGEQLELAEWIKNNTSKEDVFLQDEWVKKKNSPRTIFPKKDVLPINFLRVFANRAIFSDINIPFNEKYFREFTQRRDIVQKIHFILTPQAY